MKFQRDEVTVKVLNRFLVKLILFSRDRFTGKSETANWHQIHLADCLRTIGCVILAEKLALNSFEKALNDTQKFWSLHTAAVAMHYSGSEVAAERSFIKSQQYADDFQLSFSLQHLGKLNTELGNYDVALEQFEKSRQLRASLNQIKLVQSTDLAIQSLLELRT